MREVNKLARLLAACLFLFQGTSWAEVLRATVNDVKPEKNIVGLEYQDTKNGQKKELDVAVLPKSVSDEHASMANSLRRGDDVLLYLKRNWNTGMLEAKVMKIEH